MNSQITNRTKIAITIFNSIIAIVLIIVLSIEKIGNSDLIWIEAENADEILPSIQIFEDTEASEGKAIKSIARSHYVDSYALYNVYIPQTGEYSFWGRTYWIGGCNNTFKVNIGNTRRFVFGNDPLNRMWHWVKGNRVKLEKGNHKLFIWNDEFDARIDKILLSADDSYIPRGMGESNNILIDFSSIESSDYYQVTEDTTLYSLLQNEETENTTFYISPLKIAKHDIVKLNVNQEDYIFRVKMKSGLNSKTDSDLKIRFSYQDSLNYSFIDLGKNKVVYKIVRNGKEKNKQITTIPGNIFGEYITLMLVSKYPVVNVRLKGIDLFFEEDSINSAGNILIGSDNGDMIIDDVEYISNLTPVYSNNFFWAMKNKDDWNNLDRINGIWGLENVSDWSISGKAINGNAAFFLAGEDYWNNYSITCATRQTKPNQTYGVCFYYQNENNYYLVRYTDNRQKGSSGQVELICVRKGVETVLKKREIVISNNSWNRFDVKVLDGKIVVFVNRKQILKCDNKTFTMGKSGFWTKSEHPVFFDDLNIDPANNMSLDTETLRYQFEIRASSALDLSEWQQRPTDAIKSHLTYKESLNKNVSDFLFIDKKMFEPVYLENRFTFMNDLKWSASLFSPIPKDITLKIVFRDTVSRVLANKTEYEITDKLVRLLKNGKTLKVKKHNQAFDEFLITYHNSKWDFSFADNQTISFQDSTHTLKFYKIGLVFEGIGKSSIRFNDMQITSDSIFFN